MILEIAVLVQLIVSLFLCYKVYQTHNLCEDNSVVIGYLLVKTGLDKQAERDL